MASAGVDGRGGGLIGNVRWMRFGERELGRDLGWGRRGSRKGCLAENLRGGLQGRRADREGRVVLGAGRWRGR